MEESPGIRRFYVDSVNFRIFKQMQIKYARIRLLVTISIIRKHLF